MYGCMMDRLQRHSAATVGEVPYSGTVSTTPLRPLLYCSTVGEHVSYFAQARLWMDKVQAVGKYHNLQLDHKDCKCGQARYNLSGLTRALV